MLCRSRTPTNLLLLVRAANSPGCALSFLSIDFYKLLNRYYFDGWKSYIAEHPKVFVIRHEVFCLSTYSAIYKLVVIRILENHIEPPYRRNPNQIFPVQKCLDNGIFSFYFMYGVRQCS